MPVLRREQSGFGFPLMNRGFPMGAVTFTRNDTPALVKDAVYLILMTSPGERWYQPEWGCRAKLLLFENATSTIKETARSLVYEALTRWEPRIRLEPSDVVVEESFAPGCQLQITVSYFLAETGFDNEQQHLTVTY